MGGVERRGGAEGGASRRQLTLPPSPRWPAVSTVTYYWVKGRIDDNRLEFTRPENRKSRILTCTSVLALSDRARPRADRCEEGLRAGRQGRSALPWTPLRHARSSKSSRHPDDRHAAAFIRCALGADETSRIESKSRQDRGVIMASSPLGARRLLQLCSWRRRSSHSHPRGLLGSGRNGGRWLRALPRRSMR